MRFIGWAVFLLIAGGVIGVFISVFTRGVSVSSLWDWFPFREGASEVSQIKDNPYLEQPTAFIPDTANITPSQVNSLHEPYFTPIQNFSQLPCFLSFDLACVQYAATGNVANSVEFSGTRSSADSPYTRAYFWGRVIAQPNSALARHYSLVNRSDNPYAPFLNSLQTIEYVAIENELNPAFLYSIVDQVYRAIAVINEDAVNSDITANTQLVPTKSTVSAGNATEELLLDIEGFASDLQRFYIAGASLPNNSLTNTLNQTAFSQPTKALIYTILQYVDPTVALAMMHDTGWLEDAYQSTFAAPQLAAQMPVAFTGSISPNEVYPEEVAQVPSFDFALCAEASAYLCREQVGQLQCRRFDFARTLCASALLQL